ncbi:MAG: 3-hydroxy-5-phosphonooxypentane-2,4-dione thiolase LsrF, partial [Kiritimatiellia bacterium]|nr:3-hydroxy-5-phosphonooxypentane-2,4-dione thiolase LsrF [Kiritimatiellia bacterium]
GDWGGAPGFGKPVCLRSDAGSRVLTELNWNVLIDVADAVRLDASAMAVMVAMGDRETEALTVANLVRAADRGFQLGMPVMGVTAVGRDRVRDARYFALASRVAAENGAAIVKTYYAEGFEKVANSCPVPIVVAGGKKLPELEALELAYRAVDSGAYGVDMGRNVFQSDTPAAMLQAISAVVHDLAKPHEAFELYRSLK